MSSCVAEEVLVVFLGLILVFFSSFLFYEKNTDVLAD